MTDLAWMRGKLAELAGVDFGKLVGSSERHSIWQGGEMSQDDWRPDEDVAQAIRALEAACTKHRFDFTIDGAGTTLSQSQPQNDGPEWVPNKEWFADSPQRVEDASWAPVIAREICLAISKALGWPEPTKGPT